MRNLTVPLVPVIVLIRVTLLSAHCDYLPTVLIRFEYCIHFSYLGQENGIYVEISVNDHTFFIEEIPAMDPPSLCGATKALESVIADRYCMIFFNMKPTRHSVRGCMKLAMVGDAFWIHDVIHKEFDMFCFEVVMYEPEARVTIN